MKTAPTACARLLAACAATALGPALAVAAGPEVIYSEIASHPSAAVPGARGFDGSPAAANFATITDLTPSPDRTRWMLKATTDQDTDLGQVLILGMGAAGNTLMQESLPVPGGNPGDIVDFVGFDSYPSGGFNDAGDFAFAVRVNNNGTAAETIMRSVGGNLAPFINQFDLLFGLQDSDFTGDETLGNNVDAVHFLNDGRVAYRAGNIANIHSFYRPAIMFDDNGVFLQSNVTPVTDTFGNPQLLDDIEGGDFAITPDGAHWLIHGDHDGSSVLDDVLIVDGVVVIQEGTFLDGAVLVNDNGFGVIDDRAVLLPNGDWMANGDIDADFGGGEFAIRNGSIIAKTGDGITIGASEQWGDFVTVTGNTAGDTILVGSTDSPDANADNVIVLNGTDVVLREGDPVDLDGNGLFDDNVFINSFVANDMFLSNDFQLYFLCTLRDGAGVSLGDAFLREQIFTPTPGDMAVQISDSPDPLGMIGGQIAYSVTVRNFSPDPATNVVVSTNLDPTTSFVSSTLGAHAAGVHTANFASLPALSAETFQVVVQANAAGNPGASTSVTASETDPNPGNNTAATDTTVAALADLAVTVVDSPDPLNLVDGQIIYDIMVTNNGPSVANSVVLTADLAPESVFFSTTDGSHAGGVVTANLGGIPDGATANVTIVVDATVNGAYATSISAASSTMDPATADNTVVATTEVQIDADLQVAVEVNPPALGGIGQQATYTLEITNNGPTVATDVDWSLSLPFEVTYLTSSAGTHSSGLVSGVVPSVGVGAVEQITVDVESNAIGSDLIATFTANPTIPVDPDGANNTASALLTILDLTGGPNIELLVTNDDLNTLAGGGLATSVAPGLPFREFSSFSKVYGSSDGSNWITEARLTSPTSDDNVILVYDGALKIAVQEGATVVPDGNGSLVGSDFDFKASINDTGTYAVQARVEVPDGLGGTDTREAILKGSGSNIPGGSGTLSLIAIGNTPFPPSPGLIYDTGTSPGMESPNMLNNGDVVFLTHTDEDFNFDEYILRTSDDGATLTVLTQEGLTVPLNAIDAWDEFDQNDIHISGDGAHSLVHGDVGTDGVVDKSVVYDNTVVIQEAVTILPGFVDPVQPSSPIDEIFLAPNGDWYAWGTNDNLLDTSSDTEHWLVRNGQVIARSGDPIFPGSTDVWRTNTSSSSFNAFAADANGNYVICGFIDGSTNDNAVAVLNGERVVASELDPVDLDGDGVFDDNTFIASIGGGSTIVTDFGVITPEGRLVIPVALRAFDSVSNVGDAIASIDLGLAPACACEFDGAAGVDVFDLLAYLDLWFVNETGADIDGTAGVDVFDLLFFLDCWFPASAGTPC